MCLEPDMIVYTYFRSQHFGFKINKFVYPENELFYNKNKIFDILKTTDLREYKYIIWNYLNKYKCGYGFHQLIKILILIIDYPKI